MLNDNDILDLVRSSNINDRLGVTKEIGLKYLEEIYSLEELAIVEDIFRLLIKDAEIKVRSALSEALKLSKILPHDIAITLAKDVEEVALPILKYSEVLTDGDILEILDTPNLQKAMAISERANINDNIQTKLLRYNNPEIAGNVLANDNFPKTEESFESLLNSIADDPDAIRNLVKGISLPIKISNRLMGTISSQMLEELQEKYDVLPSKLTQIANHTVEINTVSELKHSSTNDDIDSLVRHLHNFGRLTNSLILSSLCMGRRRFFVTAIAKKAGIPKKNVIIILKQGGKEGLHSLLKKAEMPEKLYGAIGLVLKLCNEAKAKNKAMTVHEFGNWLMIKLDFFAERSKIEYINYMMAIVKQSQKQDPIADYC